MPIISIIIPTYGEPHFLAKAIQSVINQTISDWELIIVDDNNPNTKERELTEALVNSYCAKDERIKYLKHQYNKNGAAARNTGLEIATGKYVSFLDSDDEYLPTRLEKCKKELENADKSVGGVYSGCEFRKGGKTFNKFTDVKSGNFIVETLACTFMFCSGSNIFVRKEVIDDLNGFDSNFIRHQDYEFLVRLFEKYSLIAIPEILIIKNHENINMPNLEKNKAIKKQYLDKFQYIIKDLTKEQQRYIYHAQYISLAEIAMRNGLYRKSFPFYKKAKEYGSLTMHEIIKFLSFPIYNIIK